MLDDIDLINDQSQQVFRNCIDKYSHNVHFIASCSNIQKVIDSISKKANVSNEKITYNGFKKLQENVFKINEKK